MVNQPDGLAGPYTLCELDAHVATNEPELLALIKVVARVCDVPIAFVGLIDETCVRIKAQLGLPDVDELALEGAFCAYTLNGNGLLEVPNAEEDERFSASPQVTQIGVRFYAGAPLILSDGSRVGSLAIVDTRPRRLNGTQREVLEQLAVAVAHSLEGRRALRTEAQAREIAATALALSKSENLLQRIGVLTGIGGWEFNIGPQPRIHLSEACCRIYGIPAGTVISFDEAFSHFLPDSRGMLLRALDEAVQTGIGSDHEVEFIRADGRKLWVHVVGHVEFEDGRPVRALGTLQDITEKVVQRRVIEEQARKAAADAEALRKQENLLHRIGQAFGIGGWEIEIGENSMTLLSSECCRIYGVPAGTVLSLADSVAVYPPDARARLLDAFNEAQKSGESFDLELEFIRLDGRQIWVNVLGHVEFEDGRPVRALGTLQDITEKIAQRRELSDARERIAMAVDTGQIGLWDGDLTTGIVTSNRWMDEFFGFDDDASGKELISNWMARVVPEDRQMVEDAIAAATKEGKSLYYEYRVRKPDGRIGYIRSSVQAVLSPAGVPLRLYGANMDITDLRQLNAELIEQRELLQVTLKSIGDAVITTDIDGRVDWLNPVAERLTGWLTGEAHGLPLEQVFKIVNEDTRLPTENPVETCLQQGKIVGLANHTLLISRYGEEFGIEDSAAPILSESGELFGVVLVFHDVTEQRRLSGEMTYRATHDPLTGLVNRSEFEARLSRVLNKAHEDKSEHALLYIDLDQFKLINDTCGHYVGDQMLQQIGKLLSEAVRSRDTLARLGGDEFAVILEYCSTDMALRVAQGICQRMDDFRLQHEENRFRIGASIGLVPIDSRWPNSVAIQQAADKCCYAAKDAGRNRVHIWSDSDQAIRTRHGEIQWTTRIEQALDEDRFSLYAQRIVPLKDIGDGIHAEVLLRLIDADGSIVSPGIFMPAAERYNMASRIDRWVLRHALDWLIKHREAVRIDTLCVNLSGHSLGDREFHRHIVETFQHIPPEIRKQFCFEITETAAVTNLADASYFLDEVRALGVRFALDDFGAGASSFGYLKALHVDYLKIDGQFIQNLTRDPLDDATVRCFVDVARVVNVRTVAEFVDSPEVLTRLREIGVDSAQGFLLHRPAPIDELLQ